MIYKTFFILIQSYYYFHYGPYNCFRFFKKTYCFSVTVNFRAKLFFVLTDINLKAVWGGYDTLADNLENDEGLSVEFKMAVEKLCRESEPPDKEKNGLWQLISKICSEDTDTDTGI